MAVLSEQRLFGNVTALARDHSVGMGKALLVRPTTQAWPALRTVRLVPTITESDWQVYIEQRIGVEAEFGVDERSARSTFRDLRDRNIALGLEVYTALDADQVVGAVARFRIPAPNHHVARLQEVDVFPSW